jgi:N-acyl homoserine lactone hydrolase
VFAVEILTKGFSLTSNQGNFAFCGIYLISGEDADGRSRKIVYDLGHAGRRQKLLSALARHGLPPAEVDTVVLSHGHWDHAQNVDLFPNASVVLHDEELEYMRDPHPGDHATPRWSHFLLADADVRTVGDGEDVVPGLTALHLPGHSRGSIALLVPTESGTAAVTGDALATAGDAVRLRCPVVFWDQDQADASLRKVRGCADVFYPGHDRPFRMTASGEAEYLVPARPLTLRVPDTSVFEVQVAEQDRSTPTLAGRAAEITTRRGDQDG